MLQPEGFAVEERKPMIQVLTFILLDTFAFLKIPKLQLMVQSAGKNEAPIGRESHKGYRWVRFIYQGFKALSTVAVPYSAQTIIAAGHYQCAVPIEVYCCDRV